MDAVAGFVGLESWSSIRRRKPAIPRYCSGRTENGSGLSWKPDLSSQPGSPSPRKREPRLNTASEMSPVRRRRKSLWRLSASPTDQPCFPAKMPDFEVPTGYFRGPLYKRLGWPGACMAGGRKARRLPARGSRVCYAPRANSSSVTVRHLRTD